MEGMQVALHSVLNKRNSKLARDGGDLIGDFIIYSYIGFQVIFFGNISEFANI